MNKDKLKKVPICYIADNKLNSSCKGGVTPQAFAENDCYTCKYYNYKIGENSNETR